MSIQSEEESRREAINLFGEQLGEVYAGLSRSLIWLRSKWQEYRKLFGTSEERVALLNKTAPYFFRVIQRAMLDDVLLHIARLTDPAKSCGKDNLTFDQLVQHVPEANLRIALQRQVQEAKDLTDSVRRHRNRRLAHNDLDYATKVAVDLPPAPSRQEIERILEKLGKVLNDLLGSYASAEVCYREVIAHGDDADALVRLLLVAAEAEDARRKRIASGEPSWKDCTPPRRI